MPRLLIKYLYLLLCHFSDVVHTFFLGRSVVLRIRIRVYVLSVTFLAYIKYFDIGFKPPKKHVTNTLSLTHTHTNEHIRRLCLSISSCI